MLCADADKPSLKLDMIDQIQRLGIAYHFTSDIDHVLKQLNKTCFVCNNGDYDIDDLYMVALLFRLLRQHGYRISCDIFNKFKDTRGKFSEKHKSDVVLSNCEDCPFTCRWWMGPDFKRKLPFARDRLVEGYFWILGVHFEPELALVRRMMTKVIAMTSVLDDIYDVYGTYEELELFTQAVQRWDIDCINELPEYMQLFYKALINVYVEIGEILTCTGRSHALYNAKEAMKRQVRSYFAEAKWLHQQHKPTMDEYMSIAEVTSGYHLLAITSFVGMQDMVTKDNLDWLFNDPKILKASTVICRLMDYLATHKFEQGREHADSAMQCYMKQYGVMEQEVENDLRKQVDDSWKDMNECLHLTAVAMPLLMGILNLTRVMDVLYKDGGDHYTHPHIMLKDYIRSVLMDPVQ
ncbi:hypothetical protein NL676_005371 [Syzygium grande]|nr:hypothetical protein NL676_005371 [Syzygium grande]